MKQITIFLLCLFCLTFSFSQSNNTLVIDGQGNEKLLGKINRNELEVNSFNEWFVPNYESYLINTKVVEIIKDTLKQYEIKAFLGTWCGDSKREIPRFYKILDAASFPETQLEVIAVDRTPSAYKQSPNEEEKGLNIHRVPTFIFYKDGKEINRIVEFPKETFERDILNIVTKNKYTPNYKVANYLNDLLQAKGIDSLRLLESQLVPRLSEFVQGSRELNTYGYVKLRANKIMEALYIFDLNTKLFPYKYNVYDSLGEAYFIVTNFNEAIRCYTKVLELNPEDDNAPKMIEKIKKLIN